ncbi:transmembrane protein [Gossypium australe]|uniref:Transmembrane protein n=4 Tax=Gossypium TaxID=3633 RepID=A0A5B6V561_9ROSI|nr:transmembrane protein [Gossypium australe]
MSDWGPVFIAVVLFILLTPGLLIQVPGRSRYVEFGNFQTSGVSILVHSIIYFGLICIFLIAIAGVKELFLMADWAPVLIGVVLFVLLSPGLLFSFPGNSKQLEFGSMKTNGKAIAIHTLLFFAIYAVLIVALHIHIYTG